MLTEEEKAFYKEMQKIFRVEFWEGFAIGIVITSLVASLVIIGLKIL